jgi:hypothetical protein
MEDAPLGIVGLIILLTWYFNVARKQAAFVKQTFGRSYQKRSWVQPLVIGFGCYLGFFILVFVIAVAVEIANGGLGA